MRTDSVTESMLHRFSLHGGNLDDARAAFPDAPEPWIDLSTGINPVPYPIGDLPERVWTRLPGPGELDALLAVAAQAYGMERDRIAAAPGTQALIQLLPRLLGARQVAILGPTYSEHARAFAAAGAEVATEGELEGLAGADVAVVVNPNNPDGWTARPPELADLARRVGHLVVDEAFVDVMPDVSLTRVGLPENVTVLRSFGKSYGLAGLRLGFAMGSHRIVREIEAALGPWAVSGPAIEIGRLALADRGWLDAATLRLQADAARLDRLLAAAGLRVIGGTPLFRLAETADARRVFTRLASAGILVRPFGYAADWLRFGLPGGDTAWTRLQEALDVVR